MEMHMDNINSLIQIINELKDENKRLKEQSHIGINLNHHEITISDFNLNKEINPHVNTLIDGDNLHALLLIKDQYHSKIDMIYIDPPYNTKKSDFKYKDNMSHQNWCSFMNERLLVAKDLLSESGSIFISIDDNEYAYLKLLCDKVFGEENFICNFIWRKSHTVKNDKKGISTQHEYILCYAKNKNKVYFNREKVSDSYIKQTYRLSDEKGIYRTVPLHKDKNPNTYKVTAPNGKEWLKAWNYNEAGFKKLIEENMVYWGTDGNACPNKKVYLKPTMDKTYGSILLPEKVKYTGSGGKELQNLGFKKTDFIYAKPVELIQHFIEIATKKDSLILDFFAGSGTTGQAVMSKNIEDNGARKFILVTNNENKICEEITYPRIIKAMKKLNINDTFELIKVIKNEQAI